MFDVPAAKRVKREDFFDLDDEDGQSSHGKDQVKELESSVLSIVPDYGFEYDFVNQVTTPSTAEAQTESQHEEAFQFNLFRPTSKTSQPEALTSRKTVGHAQEDHPSKPALISIRSPSPTLSSFETANLSFRTSRPDSYYFAASLSKQKLDALRKSYKSSAISSDTILSTLKPRPWPGTSLPWRVIHLPAHKGQVVILPPSSTSSKKTDSESHTSADHSAQNQTRSRPRPNKKRRDLLREKARLRQRVIDETKSKEEHEREKKSRKNRERKIKRRAKERREKEQGRVEMNQSEDSDG